MTPCVLITRPYADSRALAATLAARGYRTEIAPMLIVEPVAAALDLAGVQAVLATSANGVRAFAEREARRDLPLFAVGDATARAARDAGFTAIESAAGDSQSLARLVGERLDPAAGKLLHVSGADVAGDLAGALAGQGFTIERRVLYRARAAAALDAATARLIADGRIDAVLFFSPRTARTFVSLAEAAKLAEPCAGMAAICLSQAVGEAAGGMAWRTVRIAERPDGAALIEALDAWKRQQIAGSS